MAGQLWRQRCSWKWVFGGGAVGRRGVGREKAKTVCFGEILVVLVVVAEASVVVEEDKGSNASDEDGRDKGYRDNDSYKFVRNGPVIRGRGRMGEDEGGDIGRKS